MSSALHAAAVAELTAWRPLGVEQERLRRSFLAHLDTHADGALRTGRPDHVTASALVVTPDGGQVLLVHHAKAGLWLQTGGHCEPGDASLAAAALREAVEETGLPDLALLAGGPAHLDVHPAPCGPDVRWHLDVQFVVVAPRTAPLRSSPELLDARWAAPDALPEPTDDAVRALVAAARARLSDGQSTPSAAPLAVPTDSPGGGSSAAAADMPSR